MKNPPDTPIRGYSSQAFDYVGSYLVVHIHKGGATPVQRSENGVPVCMEVSSSHPQPPHLPKQEELNARLTQHEGRVSARAASLMSPTPRELSGPTSLSDHGLSAFCVQFDPGMRRIQCPTVCY